MLNAVHSGAYRSVSPSDRSKRVDWPGYGRRACVPRIEGAVPVLRELWGKAQCKVGKHVGEWRLASPDDCTFVYSCVRCDHEERKVEHDWGDWDYMKPGECFPARRCKRCGEVEVGDVRHVWPTWEYREPGICWQDRRCTRCGEAEERLEHARGEVNYLREGSCESEAVCERCGDKGRLERHAKPRWDYADADSCLQKEFCSRCGEPAEGSSDSRIWHAWGPFEFDSERNAAVRVCTRCGEVEERPREEQAQSAVEGSV
jgi:hypothetical protein